jgi:hypothetical protein
VQNLICEYGSEFDFDSNAGYFISDNSKALFSNAELFRSGRDALKAIAERYGKNVCKVVVPALCCESMVKPFEVNDYEIVYFKLNSDLSAITDDVLPKLKNADVFLYINYFGFRMISDETLQLIRDTYPGLILVEDKTHDILSAGFSDFKPDYSVCSIRKWLAIPDGGILFSKITAGDFTKNEDTFFSDIRTMAFKNKNKYFKTGDTELKDLFRSQFSEANEYLDNDDKVVGMSKESVELLMNIDFRKIAETRGKNIDALSTGLSALSAGLRTEDKIRQLGPKKLNGVNIYYPIIISDRDKIQHELAIKGIYCPVIWPLPPKAAGVCGTSDYISNNMLAIPCDQRYSSFDMNYITDEIKKVLGE